MKLAGVLLVVGFTLASAAANLVPFHIPTKRERQRAAQAEMAVARREKIAAMTAEGVGCDRSAARELARELVFDGRSALAFADDFERRCGTDIVVRRWATKGDRLLARLHR